VVNWIDGVKREIRIINPLRVHVDFFQRIGLRQSHPVDIVLVVETRVTHGKSIDGDPILITMMMSVMSVMRDERV
jgi:hypothetical protein